MIGNETRKSWARKLGSLGTGMWQKFTSLETHTGGRWNLHTYLGNGTFLWYVEPLSSSMTS